MRRFPAVAFLLLALAACGQEIPAGKTYRVEKTQFGFTAGQELPLETRMPVRGDLIAFDVDLNAPRCRTLGPGTMLGHIAALPGEEMTAKADGLYVGEMHIARLDERDLLALHVGGERHRMKAGDVLTLPAGTYALADVKPGYACFPHVKAANGTTLVPLEVFTVRSDAILGVVGASAPFATPQ